MTRKSICLTDQLYKYIDENSTRESEILRNLREETAHLAAAGMQISPEQGQFMAFLIELIGAKKTLEVGVFTGYSSLVVACALPENGKVVACDISEEWTSIARRYWEKGGVTNKIDLRIAPAVQTLQALLDSGQADSFDFAFIDADKPNYNSYFELALKLVRVGGLIAIDNTLWSGKVADPTLHDADTDSIRELNRKIYTDKRISLSLLPIYDGITLALRKI